MGVLGGQLEAAWWRLGDARELLLALQWQRQRWYGMWAVWVYTELKNDLLSG